jgi:hypothetical protein
VTGTDRAWEVARARLLARTSIVLDDLDDLDPGNLAQSMRAISPRLMAILLDPSSTVRGHLVW